MLRIIAEQGIQGTPMSQLAKEAGVATGTIYHHFRSKEEILNAIYLSKKQDFQQILEAHLQPEAPFEKQFEQLWLGFFRYYMEHPLVFRFGQQLAGTPILNAKTRREGESYYAQIFAFFERGITAGVFRPMNARLMTHLLHGSIDTLVALCLDGDFAPESDVLEQAVLFSWRAVASDPYQDTSFSTSITTFQFNETKV